MLQGHVQVLHGFRFFGQDIEKAVADMRRIGVHDAHPLDAVGVRKLAQEMGQSVGFAEVFAVARGILGHQNQLLDTLFRELLGLGDD